MTVISIDPGKTGAVAILDDRGDLIDIADLADCYAGPKLSAGLLQTTILDLCCDLPSSVSVCVIEDQNSHLMGRQSAFNFGRALGILEAVPHALGIRTVLVMSSVWKKGAKLSNDKNVARAAASTRWPEHADRFKRIKDDGRAEAALLGAWWLDTQQVMS